MGAVSSFADYSADTNVEQLDAALRAAGVDGVTHYISGLFARRVESPAIVNMMRALLWPQMGISVPTLGTVNGAYDASRARDVYGFPAGSIMWLDIEPTQFRSAPLAWAARADEWCGEVRVAGYVPGVYGTDDTVAACANQADRIWRAKPGMCDPAGPGLADDFFAGRRAVQCRNGVFAGLEMDINYAQFDLGGIMTEEEHNWLEFVATQLDPSKTGFAGTELSGNSAFELRLASLIQGTVPPVDVGALASALAQQPGFADAIATAVAHKVGAALDKA